VAHYQAYADQVDGLQGGRPYEPHSLLPGILAETGILGLVTFLGFTGSMLVALERVRRRWRDEQPQLAGYAAGFVLAILAYLASGLFLHMAYPRYFWLLAGLAVAVIVISERQARQAGDRASSPGSAR
jgi:putative inorganic carbon (hco3(-)) transporter